MRIPLYEVTASIPYKNSALCRMEVRFHPYVQATGSKRQEREEKEA